MKVNIKQIFSLALVTGLTIGAATSAFAAEYDLVNLETGDQYDFQTWTFDENVIVDTTYYGEKYTLEINENQYVIKEIIEEMNKGKSVQEAVDVLEPYANEELAAKSITAVTETVLNLDYTAEATEDTYFQVKALAEDGTEVTGQTFAFVDSKGWLAADGQITADLSVEAGNTTTVQVSVDGTEITGEFTLTVADAAAVASIDKVMIADQNDATVERNVAVTGDSIVVTEATLADGTVEVAGSEAVVANLDLTAGGVLVNAEVASSDPSMFTIDEDGAITVIQAGTANVVITWNEEEFTFPVEVGENARIATNIEALAPVELTTSDDTTRVVNVVITDQYGDDVLGAADTTNVVATSGDTAITTVAPAADGDATDNEVPYTLTAVVKGTATITFENTAATAQEIGTVDVTVAEPGETIASYDIRLADNTSDYNLDVYTGTVTDNTVDVEFVGKDDSGIVKTVFDDTATTGLIVNTDDTNINENRFEIYTSDDTIATASITGSTITITAVAEGTADITIKEGNITRDSITVTIVDTTPVLTSFGLADGVTEIELGDADSPFSWTDIADNFVAKDQNNEDFSVVAADVDFFTTDETVFTGGDNTIILTGSVDDTATLTVKYEGEIVTVPVIITDTTAPTATVGATDTATQVVLDIDENAATVALDAQSITDQGGGLEVATLTFDAGVDATAITIDVAGAGATASDTVTFTITDEAGNTTTYLATWDGANWGLAVQ